VNIHDNLLVDTELGCGGNAGGPQGGYCTFNHNTLYNSSVVLANGSEGPFPYCTFTNNIFTANVGISLWSVNTGHSRDPHYTTLDYNLYITGNAAIMEYGVNYSLASWITHYGGDAHSLAGSPTFVGGANPAEIEDFELDANSPGKGAASDSTDMGADISQIGIQD
jgi:hypothetical protein